MNQEKIPEQKTITVYLTGYGLGNNLYTISGAIAFARATDRKLNIFWEGGLYKNVPFEAFFYNILDVDILHKEPKANDFDLYLTRQDIKRLKARNEFNLIESDAESIYIKTPLPFHPGNDYSWMKPLQHILNAVDQLLKDEKRENLIGIHIIPRLRDSCALS